MNKENYKRIQPQRLQFPTNLEFRSSGNGLLECNGKTVQIIPSEIIHPQDNPPTDITIHGIGKYSFNLSDADILIFSFANIQTQKTDCAIIGRDELWKRLKPYHRDDNKISFKLILTERGLHECYNAGGEAFFLFLWNDTSKNFTSFLNNYSVFTD